MISPLASASTIRVAVAANFKPVLDVLAEQFEKKHDARVLVSSASSGILYNQISHGAPFDLFLSADDERPAMLEKNGLIVPDSRKTYAYGRLVLWSHRDQPVTLKTLEAYKGRLAIANPALAPYGAAAQQTLEKMNLWQGYQGRLVQGASIQQAWQFVASGNVDLGLVAKAQVLDQPKNRILDIPESYHAPIRQELVLLKQSKEPKARAFMDYLLNDTSQAYIASQGYRPAK
ncbi:molybdate ABC transporter substrate-binding protein [Endozoicomonas montiporae]|uniref:molybdate ABC transporter substrate-binding protein n=1 Tax=Endozoicomonas montiporae TaxID=1027273 RepID=UPI001C9D9343|nr:molybdate ABC transporter substrate-binding protein [Endozoicomonas montiporae]